MKVSGTFAPAAFVIVIGCVGGLIAALFPSDANPWVVPVTAAITAFAALVRTVWRRARWRRGRSTGIGACP